MNKRYENNMLGFCASTCLSLSKAGLPDDVAADAAAVITDSTSPEALYSSDNYKKRVVGDAVELLKAGKIPEAERATVLQRVAKGAAQFVQYLG